MLVDFMVEEYSSCFVFTGYCLLLTVYCEKKVYIKLINHISNTELPISIVLFESFFFSTGHIFFSNTHFTIVSKKTVCLVEQLHFKLFSCC